MLGLERSQLQPEDFQLLARSGDIPWNANANDLKAALEKLTNIKVFEVRRCDESGDAYVGMGAFEGWAFGCPYLLKVVE